MTVNTVMRGALRVVELPPPPDMKAYLAEIEAHALAKSENATGDVNTLMDDSFRAEGARLWVKDGRGGWLLRDARPSVGGGTFAEVFPKRYDRARYVYEPPYKMKRGNPNAGVMAHEPRLLRDTKFEREGSR